MSITKNIIAALAAFAAVASVHAVTVDYTFDFNGSSALSFSKTFNSTPGGVSVTVTANTYRGGVFINSTGTDSKVGQYSGGLGVTNRYESGNDPTHTLDSNDGVDYLIFQFTPSVDVNKLTIGYQASGYDSDFRWWLNNDGALSSTGGTLVNGTGTGTYDINVAATNEYQYLIIAADRDNSDKYNGIKISSLAVSRTTTNTPGVPDSGSTVAMLGLGLMSLAMFKRRK